jgi:tetrahydromethanopterin S-methyltransferase subunit H
MCHTLIFAAGALMGPAVGRALRPLLRETIKGGIVVGRGVQRTTTSAWEELRNITDEARAELDAREVIESPREVD